MVLLYSLVMSEYSYKAEDIFPAAYGNEEETGLMVNRGEGFSLAATDDFLQHAQDFIPNRLRGHDEYLINGSRVYVPTKTASDAGLPYDQLLHLELSSSECATIDELVPRIRVSESLLLAMTETYAEKRSIEDNNTTSIRIQQRVVDSHNNRNGCHDIYALNNPHMFDKQNETETTHPGHVVLGHLATRSFVTGAGLVTEDGLHFSQKIGGLDVTEGRGPFGSMYSLRPHTYGDNTLFEVRCNDINISDWAKRMRVGASALAMAIAQTPLSTTIEDLAEHDQFANEAIECNMLQLNPNGTIEPDEKLCTSVNYQRQLAKAALFDLPNYIGELPEEHERTALELLAYCNDFDKVLSGKESIAILADRADWAAKFVRVIQDVQNDASGERSLTDLDSRARDLMYDYIRVQATNGVLDQTVYGFGYKLRDSRKFKQTTPQRGVEQAYVQAPTSTRAHIRANILKSGHDVRHCSWDKIMYRDKYNGEFFEVRLPDVRITCLDNADITPVFNRSKAHEAEPQYTANVA